MTFWRFWQKANPVFYSFINGKITIGRSYRRMTLFANNIPQSGGEYVFMWRKVLKSLNKFSFKPKNCLVLGVGGGTVIKELINHYPRMNIVGVEIDLVMIEIGQKHFGLESHKNIELVAQDAVNFITQERANKYDLIIVDVFLGLFNPPSVRTISFLKNLKRIMKSNGVVFYNSHYQKIKHEEYENFTDLAGRIFGQTQEVFAYPRNRILRLSSLRI